MNPRMLSIFFILILSLVSVNAATVIDDFENNNITNPLWTKLEGSGTFSTQSGTVYEGTYAMQGDTDTAYSMDYDYNQDVNTSIWFRFTSTSVNGSIIGVGNSAQLALGVNRGGFSNKFSIFDGSSYNALSGTNPNIVADSWYLFVMEYLGSNISNVYVYSSDGTTLLGYIMSLSHSASDGKIRVHADTSSGTTYIDYITFEEATVSSVTASFTSDDNAYSGELELTDTSTSVGVTIDNWDWYIDTVKVSDDQNYNYTATQSTDYNVCLFVEDSTDTYNDMTCSTESTGKWVNSLWNYNINPGFSIQFNSDANTEGLALSNWEWLIDSVSEAVTENYTKTNPTPNTDYNACLLVSNAIASDQNCFTVSTGDWSPLINWEDAAGSWVYETTNLDFNITAVGQNTPGIKIYWSLTAYDYNNLIINDTNVWDATGIICDDYNFQDNTSCSYPFNTSTIPDGNYYWDLNIYNSFGDENDSVNLLSDNTAPILTFDLNYESGFTLNLDINFYLNCNDNLSPTNRYLLYLNDVNVNDTWETNDTNLDLTEAILNGNNDTNAFCYDLAGNYSNDTNTSVVYALWFDLINEDTGAKITNLLTDVNVIEASVYTYDGNIDYDLNGLFPKWFVGDTQVLRFDFTYNDDAQTEISREMDFSLLTDANANICVAPFQTLYEQIFVSASTRSVVVYNDYAKCFNLASKTKFAYENALMVKGYTINKPYYLYTWYDGVKILLALIEGSTPSIMNLDTLIFNRADYTVNIATDTVGISPKLNTVTGAYDTNTIEIYYKSLRGTNESLQFKIYNDTNLLWTYTETSEPNELLVEFYYYGMDINADNLLQLEITTSVDGETTITDYYFYIDGSSYAGTLNPFLAIIVAFGLMFVALTFVAYRYALGWFGILMGIIAIGVLAMAPGYWYIRFAQAIILIIIVFIVLIFKNETAGLN